MSLKICVLFLAENTDHEISVDPNITVLQFKELLRQQIPFFQRFSSIPTEVLKLSLEGFDGGGGELTGNVMEDGRLLSAYPLREERHPVLLALERPVEKIGCSRCQKPFVQWSNDRLSCGDERKVDGEDRWELEKRKARIAQLLNCGHSVCLECWREGLVAAEEAVTEEKEFLLVDPSLLTEEGAKEQNRVAQEKAEEKARRKREREKAENVWKFVCCDKSCGVVTYWRKDQERSCHEGMQRLVHLKKREWVEAEKARGRCFIKTCGAEAMFFCSDCGVKHCISHFQKMHLHEDMSDHVPQVLLSSQFHPPISDIFKTRFCCYCGGGETASSCVRGGGRPHCEHRDAGLVSATERTRVEVMEQLSTLGNLQADCWRQLVAWNGVLEQLQEHRVKGVERIRKQFDDLISRLEARKEDMVMGLRRRYREKEMELVEKMEALGVLSGELEAGLVHHRQSLAELAMASDRSGGVEVCVVRDVVDMNAVQERLSQLASDESLARFSEIPVEFEGCESVFEDFCQMSKLTSSRGTPTHPKFESASLSVGNEHCLEDGAERELLSSTPSCATNGINILEKGDRYEGDFKDGNINHGKGTKVYTNGDRYEGDWVDGSQTGKGVFTWANGDRYEGDYKDGKQHGKGTKSFADGNRYEGDWVDGFETGEGVFTWGSATQWVGDRYEGHYRDNKRHGKGTYVFSSGNRYVGDWVNDSRTGKGVFTWANGDRYEGDYKDGKHHGKGTKIFADGNCYEGDWVDGFETGKGVFTWGRGNGDRYEGDFKDNKRHGKGTYVFADGNRYDGDWVDGSQTGKGVYTWANGDRYEGDWVNGSRTGKGAFTWGSATQWVGDRYEGDYKDNKHHGKGICVYANGNRYEGDWVDGSRTGMGVFTWANGDRYEGDYKDGKHHGKGTKIFADGNCYEGDWVDGFETGKGVFTWGRGNGDRYEGDFKDNKRHGKGTMIYANGNRYEGDWINDSRTGRGVFTWNNGDRYEGDFKDGKHHGKGTKVFANGNRYFGDWVNESTTGRGVFTWNNGNRYEGDFIQGKANGKGAFKWANGDHYEGDFANGMKHGKGVLTSHNGGVTRGEWNNDELTKRNFFPFF